MSGVIRITPDQLGPLLASSDESLVGTIRRALVRRLPERVIGLDRTMLDRMIAGGVGKARAYGFSETEHLLAFVLLMFGVAPGFDQQPALGRVLKSDAPPADRLRRLKGRELEPAWTAARKGYDARAWNFPERRR
jgi:hypothetical protein